MPILRLITRASRGAALTLKIARREQSPAPLSLTFIAAKVAALAAAENKPPAKQQTSAARIVFVPLMT